MKADPKPCHIVTRRKKDTVGSQMEKYLVAEWRTRDFFDSDPDPTFHFNSAPDTVFMKFFFHTKDSNIHPYMF